MELKHQRMIDDVALALVSARNKFGKVNPQYSYYERLVNETRHSIDSLYKIHGHILLHGGLEGL